MYSRTFIKLKDTRYLFKTYFRLTYFHNKNKQKLFSFRNGNDYVFFCSITNESRFNDAFSWRESVLQREGKRSEDTVVLLYEI